MGELRTSYPRFARDGGANAMRLTNDDLALLLVVYRHRFIRADDLYRLFPERSQDRLSRRLTQLFRNGFLDRPKAQIDRFRDGPSQALVYGLDNAGARVVAERFEVSTGSANWRSRNRAFTRENLDHALAVTRCMVDLERACRARPGMRFVPFDEILASSPETTRRSVLPGRWSVPVSWSMARAEVHIIPDAIFALRHTRPDSSTVQAFYFLEVDRGTMTVVPSVEGLRSEGFLYRATILRKLLAYSESWQRDLHQSRFGMNTARVLLLTTSDARAHIMQRAGDAHIVQKSGAPAGAFLFGSLDAPVTLDRPFRDAVGRPSPLVDG